MSIMIYYRIMNRIESGVISRRRLLGKALPLTAAAILIAANPGEAKAQTENVSQAPAEVKLPEALTERLKGRFMLIGGILGGVAGFFFEGKGRNATLNGAIAGAIAGAGVEYFSRNAQAQAEPNPFASVA